MDTNMKADLSVHALENALTVPTAKLILHQNIHRIQNITFQFCFFDMKSTV